MQVGSWTSWETVAECVLLNGKHVKIYQRKCVNGSFCSGANRRETKCTPKSSQKVRISSQSQFKGVITLEKNPTLANETGFELHRVVEKRGAIYKDIVSVSKERLRNLYQKRNITVKEINIDVKSIVRAGEYLVMLNYSVMAETSLQQDSLSNVKPVVATDVKTDIFAGIRGYRSFTEPSLIVVSGKNILNQKLSTVKLLE